MIISDTQQPAQRGMEFLQSIGKACLKCGRRYDRVDLHQVGEPSPGNQLVACTDCLQAPDVVLCPAWCARGQEHTCPEDTEHWSDEIQIGDGLMIHIEKDRGCTQYCIRSGDHIKIELMDSDVVRLVTALVKCMELDLHSWTKKVVLEH